MPNVYRYPRIVFPDLVEHQLYDKFQYRDKNYILPGGAVHFVPFDDTYLDETDSIIIVPIITFSDMYVRVARMHLWLEPTDGYPRGTKIKVAPFLGDSSYKRTVYVGMYSILPMDSISIDTLAGGIVETHNDDMQVTSSIIVRIRFSDKDDNVLPNLGNKLPVFTGLLEVM